MNSEQTDISVKHLLKQVYAAHIAKIKGLEDEIETLKNKLHESERKLKQRENECKRCGELEEAFKSCKAALDEQSKWFENLGQKFSVFNNSENKTLSKNGTSLSLDDSEVQADISINPQESKAVSEKPVNRQNLFRNLMSFNSDENPNSLDLCSLPFPQHFAQDYSTLNSDLMILAPDTVDIISDANSKHKERKKKVDLLPKAKTKVTSVKDIKEFSDEAVMSSGNETECKETNRPAKKRPHSELSGREKSSKRLSMDSVVNDSILKPITKLKSEMKSQDSRLQGDQEMKTENPSKDIPTISVMKSSNKEKTEGKNLNPQMSPEDFISSAKKSDNAIDTKCNNKKRISPLDIEISKDVSEVHQTDHLKAEKQNDTHSKEETNVTLKDSQYQVSPSLLPLNKNSKPVLDPLEHVLEDINDFQELILSKKQVKDDGAWTACDKKKLKKRPPVTILKSTSKFKMQLDSLPPNYKKRTYRQTKLSKSIFQPKASSSSSGTKTGQVLGDYNVSSSSSEENDHVSLPVQSTVKAGVIDFDATCIPDNYEIIASGTLNREKISNENVDDRVHCADVDNVNESSNGSSSSSPVCRRILNQSIEKSDSNDAVLFEDFISKKKGTADNEHLNSFDRLPKKEEPNYKYKEETVRKKAERKQLNGFDCKECENYYSELGLTDKEKQERLKKCSRHRAKFAPPATPEHFWELEFPDTQECKARGYLNETQKVKLKSHRRRPLDL